VKAFELLEKAKTLLPACELPGKAKVLIGDESQKQVKR
jgi:hypothetical protein